LQAVIASFNPIGFLVLILSLSLYFLNGRLFTYSFSLLFLFETVLLFGNVIYYREFSTFISLDTIKGAQAFNGAMSKSITTMLEPHDFVYLINLFLILLVVVFGLKFIYAKPHGVINNVAWSCTGIFLILLNLTLAESNRPQLLGRTFDQTYIVKYLGLNFFSIYNSYNTINTAQEKNSISNKDIDEVLTENKKVYGQPNPKYYGIARKKNVIIIHLESFQQFLINFKVNGQEVTPFLNQLYADKNTLSYKNFFHEVGQGKTSDAETMLESGVFGLPTGSFFTKMGVSSTFQAAPAILKQEQGYDSAVFHGNVGSFYSRDKVYKNMGYNYFFDQKYFNHKPEDNVGFGLKDKLMFQESVPYLEKLQQPFYAKYITVTNHYPYDLPDADKDGFVAPDTGNKSVDNYFNTAHYLDASLKEFFDYLKASKLYDKSLIVLYGDHYGISNDKNKYLAPLLNKDANTWNKFDDIKLQRVPFMIHMKGLHGGIKDEYGGEIDVLPTILDLVGINSHKYIQLGTDLLSNQHDPNVVFRDNTIVNQQYTIIKKSNDQYDIYDNESGDLVEVDETTIDKIYQAKKQLLDTSDLISNKNLLRLYTPVGFQPVDPGQYNYDDELTRLNELNKSLGNASTSLFSKNDEVSTADLYNK